MIHNFHGTSGTFVGFNPKLAQAAILYKNSDKSAQEICEFFGFSRRTLFGYLKKTDTNKAAAVHKIPLVAS